MSLEAIDYVTHLAPPLDCLIGGDFNAHHDIFEPGAPSQPNGQELARRANTSGMDFIGTPGTPTQVFGHVLDLTFSNISFARAVVRPHRHSGTVAQTMRHRSLLTLGRGVVPLDQFDYRIPESELGKFAGLIQNGIASLPDTKLLTTYAEVDSYAAALQEVFDPAIRTTSKPNRGQGSPAGRAGRPVSARTPTLITCASATPQTGKLLIVRATSSSYDSAG